MLYSFIVLLFWQSTYLLVLRISLCEIRSSSVCGLYFSTLKQENAHTRIHTCNNYCVYSKANKQPRKNFKENY